MFPSQSDYLTLSNGGLNAPAYVKMWVFYLCIVIHWYKIDFKNDKLIRLSMDKENINCRYRKINFKHWFHDKANVCVAQTAVRLEPVDQELNHTKGLCVMYSYDRWYSCQYLVYRTLRT